MVVVVVGVELFTDGVGDGDCDRGTDDVCHGDDDCDVGGDDGVSGDCICEFMIRLKGKMPVSS